jgi:hypothetical protein
MNAYNIKCQVAQKLNSCRIVICKAYEIYGVDVLITNVLFFSVLDWRNHKNSFKLLRKIVVTTDSDLNEIESKYSFLEFQMNISLQS